MTPMRNKLTFSFIKHIVFSAFLIFSIPALAQLVTYPEIPGFKESADYSLSVNGSKVQVLEFGPLATKDYLKGKSAKDEAYFVWWNGQKIKDGLVDSINVANFSGSGQLNFVLTAKDKITSFVIRPKSAAIVGKVAGNKLSFSIARPGKIYVEVNKYKHLAILADPLEVNPPKQGDPNVLYFANGISEPGTINLKSNQTIYLAAGAVVKSNIKGSDISNVKITGRGILQGFVMVKNATNLRFDGILIHNPYFEWCNTITNCHHSGYENVKIFSYSIPWGTDGIDPVGCTNFSINDCFIRTGDDCVAIKSNYGQKTDSIAVTNCLMAGYNSNDGVTLGFELDGDPVQNILVKNIDILYAQGNNSVQGHSGFSIISDGPGYVNNIRFEDIRVEEHIEFKNFELKVTTGHLYGIDRPGHIKGIYLKNISWENIKVPIVLSGHGPGNMVEDVTFDNCKVGGKLLKSTSDARFEINPYVQNIKFINSGK